jgi:hypothetical protein
MTENLSKRNSMKKKIVGLAMVGLVGFAAVQFTSCSGCQQAKTEQPTMDAKKDSMDQARVDQLKKIFFNIPSPVEMASLIKDQGYTYDKKMLNGVENVDKYLGEVKQAVNLGIYGADLSYASIFDQKQESMASAMAIEGGINDSTITKLAEYQDNRDSVLKIVTGAYADLNGYLKENNRIEVSALVISGGWLEALHLCLQYSEKPNSTLIRQRIGEQKMVLENLLNYYESFDNKPSLAEMKADLMEIQKELNKVEITSEKTTVTKGKDGVMTIGNNSKTNVKDDTLKSLNVLVKKIRSKYVA